MYLSVCICLYLSFISAVFCIYLPVLYVSVFIDSPNKFCGKNTYMIHTNQTDTYKYIHILFACICLYLASDTYR